MNRKLTSGTEQSVHWLDKYSGNPGIDRKWLLRLLVEKEFYMFFVLFEGTIIMIRV